MSRILGSHSYQDLGKILGKNSPCQDLGKIPVKILPSFFLGKILHSNFGKILARSWQDFILTRSHQESWKDLAKILQKLRLELIWQDLIRSWQDLEKVKFFCKGKYPRTLKKFYTFVTRHLNKYRSTCSKGNQILTTAF